MAITLDTNHLEEISKEKRLGKTIVLTGGSFDILHAGHIEFLNRAKKLGDILVVFIESDEHIKKLKGKNRPINPQKVRKAILSGISAVDYVVTLKNLLTDSDYEILVNRIKPDIIARSGSDLVFGWEKEMEKTGKLKLLKVMERIPSHSTTALAHSIK